MHPVNPIPNYYVCIKCKSFIVWETDCIQRVYRNKMFTGHCIFEHLMNVNYYDIRNEDRVQRVDCMSCNQALGFKYVRVPAAQLCFLVQNETRSKLNLERLSYWNGHQYVSGYSEMLPEPIPGPEPVFQLVPEPPLPPLAGGLFEQLHAVAGYKAIPPPQPPDPPQASDDEPPPILDEDDDPAPQPPEA